MKLSAKQKKAVKEVLKEIGRWLAAAVLPSSIIYFSELSVDWAVKATLFLRIVDRILHLSGKALKNEQLEKGLTQF